MPKPSNSNSSPPPTFIRILNPSIDDYENTVVIRGILDLDSLAHLNIDYYQRELLPSTSRRNITQALESSERLPDIILGMRGETFSMEGKNLLLHDPVFIIDGQQRRGSIIEYLSKCENPKPIRLGATIHINTSPTWERELFHKLNQFQTKVSPNILLRNTKEDHSLVTTLYGLTKSDRTFVLYNRVSWTQNMGKMELFTARTMLTSIIQLHSHFVSGRSFSLHHMVEASDRLIDQIGLATARANVRTFYDTIDECWGIRQITIKGGAPQLRSTFQIVLAKLLSNHPIFWKQDKRLEVGYLHRRKLASFKLHDPEIARLTGAGGAARISLYLHLINHLNSGKRTGKLVSRNPITDIDFKSNQPQSSDED